MKANEVNNILRLPQVKALTGHKAAASIYSQVRAGLFPKQIPIGPRSTGWPADEVEQVIEAQRAGLEKPEIQALVECLHAERIAKAQALRERIKAGPCVKGGAQ